MKKKCATRSLPISLFFLGLVSASSLAAQSYNYPLNRYSRFFLEQGDSSLLSSFQALPEAWYSLDSVWGHRPEKHYSKAGNTLNYDHLLTVEKDDFQLYLDILLNFEVGKDTRNKSDYTDTTLLFRNMRGFSIKGNIGEKISFETSLREIQSALPLYLFDYVDATDVMPGTGRVKPFNGTGYDHNIAQGYVSFAASNHVNIQFGSQKNFIGSGYRSLLLSDNAFSYPQLKISSSFLKGKIRYHVIHAWLQTLERLPIGDTPESLFKMKGGSFKYLEIRPVDALCIGLFEGFIWDRFDTETGNQGFPTQAYIPIIGVNSLIYGLDAEENGLIGLDVSLRPIKGLRLFGQYALDAEQRDAYQLGLRSTDLLTEGLTISLEYASSGEKTYSGNNLDISYTHYGQALAHPMGNGFSEWHADILYFHKRIFADARITLADERMLMNGHYAGDQLYMALPPDGYLLESQHLEQIDVRVGYFFNPKSNFNVYAGWMFREQNQSGMPSPSNIFKFGIEMSLMNTYEDF